MPERPNVLLITFDSVRPDHLGCYGYHGTETPHWNRLAAEGVRFSTAYCSAPNTWMSHAALFTGCHPPRNGVRSPLGKLNPSVPTLAEVFAEQDYQTFGLPALSLLSPAAGFGRGFETYPTDGLISEFAGAKHHRPLAKTLHVLREWWQGDRTAEKPALVWLHDFGTHVAQGSAAEQMLELPDRYREAFSPYAQFYDGKIAYSDAAFLAPVLDMLGCETNRDDWVVVLASDHGEDLAAVERGLPGHDQDLSEGSMRVPLVVWAPGRIDAGTVVPEPVRLLDLLPTLAELAGFPGDNLGCDGASMLPLLSREGASRARSVRDIYFENAFQGFLGLRQGNLKLVLSEPENEAGAVGKRIGWRISQIGGALISSRLTAEVAEQRRRREQQRRLDTPAEKLLEPLLAPTSQAELYDLETDPNEIHNLAEKRGDDVDELRAVLRSLFEGSATPSETFTDAERAAIEERLSDLGYL